MTRCEGCGKEGYGSGKCSSCRHSDWNWAHYERQKKSLMAIQESFSGYYHPKYNKAARIMALFILFLGFLAVLVNCGSKYLLLMAGSASVMPWGIIIWMILVVTCTFTTTSRRCFHCGCIWTGLLAIIGGVLVLNLYGKFSKNVDNVVACFGCPYNTDLSGPNPTCPHYYGNETYATLASSCIPQGSDDGMELPACFCTSADGTCSTWTFYGLSGEDTQPNCNRIFMLGKDDLIAEPVMFYMIIACGVIFSLYGYYVNCRTQVYDSLVVDELEKPLTNKAGNNDDDGDKKSEARGSASSAAPMVYAQPCAPPAPAAAPTAPTTTAYPTFPTAKGGGGGGSSASAPPQVYAQPNYQPQQVFIGNRNIAAQDYSNV